MNVARWLSRLLPIVFLFAGYAVAQPRWTSTDDFIRKVEAAAANDGVLKELTKKRGDAVTIVFVPGILGSELVRGTRTIWGSGSPTVGDLALPEDGKDPSITARVLGEFSLFLGLRREDVYGEYLKALEGARGGRGDFVEFAYDWRLDIRENARRLDVFLRKEPKLQGRSIIIVGHSMGGVITWYWQSKYFKREENDMPRVRRLLLVGAPLHGSCEMVRMLLDGYRDIPEAGFLTNVVYSRLFRDLRPAAFTFPSVFQLLPRVPADPSDTYDSCLEIPSEAAEDRVAANYFDIAFWRGSFGMYSLNKAGAPWVLLTQNDSAKFFSRFTRVLDAAREFRSEINLDQLRVPAVLFYSDQHATISKARSKKSGNEYQIEFPFTSQGDGRVAQDSASNHKYQGELQPRPWRLDLTHGELPKDKRFVSYLVKDLARMIRVEVALAYAKLLLTESKIFDAYYKAGGRAIAVSALTADLDATWRQELEIVVNAVNAEIQERTGRVQTYTEVKQLQQGTPEDNAARNRALVPALEAVLKDDGQLPDAQRPYAVGRLGFAHFYAGNYRAAVAPLQEAYQLVQRIPESQRSKANEQEFVANVTGLLGASLLQTGACEKAAPFLEQGRKLGNRTATVAMTITCIEASTGKAVALTR